MKEPRFWHIVTDLIITLTFLTIILLGLIDFP